MPWNYISERRQILRAVTSRIGKTAVIYPAAFLVATALGTGILGMIFYVNERFGATTTQIGLLYACWSLAYVVGCLALRPLAAKMLPRYSILVATTLLFLVFSAILAADSLGIIFVLYAVFGLCLSFFWPPLMGWLSANIEGEALGRAMGRFNLCWSSGVIISPVLGGRLSEIAPGLPIRVCAGLFLATASIILGAVLTLSSLGRDDDAHTAERKATRETVDNSTFLRFPAWLGLFASFAVYGAILNVFPISAQSELGMTKTTIGLLLFFRAGMNTLALGWMGRVESWHFRGRQMVIGSVLFACVVGMLAWVTSAVLVGVFMVLIGLFGGQAYANSLFHGVSGSVRRSQRMAIHEALLAGGAIFGSALGGSVYQHFSMFAVYAFCAVLLLLGAAGQFALVRMKT